ncbi:hypothetical protein [Sphingomonas solaris]|uniref:Uncharacterized protein n=1 Tax=Alterirhizorhabdus solaris TaxID=2529389 RepID=A0A558QWF4_9SPHN|nr:hypothetical protein [Sphingomonas solaris]TVV71474.1 hypothetical protein FOY91_16700 [Sphingomonas solaris]
MPPTDATPHLFGLRGTARCRAAIAGALARIERLHHDLPDLGMNEGEWARLFAGSHDQADGRSGHRR